MGVVIVAIPSEGDYVWRVSSEKKPHMTLLHLGDVQPGPQLAQIETFLTHVVATTMFRFGLQVDHRGTLGDNKADVLFLDEAGNKTVDILRGNLLANAAVKTAYLSAEQFEGWTPHVTLGYPETPAKPDPREYPGFGWISFDRIALWVGDSEGPEYLLKESEGAFSMSVKPAEDVVEDFLAHHGVLGMKWGVRNDTTTSPRTSRRVARKDAKFESTKHIHNTLEFGSGKVDLKVQKEAFRKLNKVDIPRIRKNPKYDVIDKKQYDARAHYKNPKKYKDLTENHAAVLKDFDKEVAKAWQQNVRESVANLGTNASGTKEYRVTTTADSFRIEPVAIKHADSPTMLTFAITRDADGFITNVSDTPDVTPTERSNMTTSVAHGEDVVEDFLSHHGVLGMKWGVRREERLLRLNRVADGTATRGDRLKVSLAGVSSDSVRKSGGLAPAAKIKAAELQGRKDRIQSGNATFKDRVALSGGDRLHDSSGARVAKANKKLAKADSKWQENIYSTSGAVAVHNESARTINPVLESFNAHYKNDDINLFERPNEPAAKRYMNDYNRLAEKHLRDAVKTVHGTSPSGKLVAKLDTSDPNNWLFTVQDTTAKHAAGDPWEDLYFAVDHDASGFVTRMRQVDPAESKVDVIKHGEDLAEDFLSHHGVLGMKWGVRKPGTGPGSMHTSAGGTPAPKKTAKDLANQGKAAVKKEVKERTGSEVVVRTKAGEGVRTVGGNNQQAHADAIKVRQSEQIAKRSTIDALSTQDLQGLVNRMNLEQQYRNLAVREERQTPGEKFANELLLSDGTKAFSKLGPGAPIAQHILRKNSTLENKALRGKIKGDGKKDN